MQASRCELVRQSWKRYEKPTNEVLGILGTAETQTLMFDDLAICAALEGGPFDFA
jgi:hypothetical protein